MFLISNYDEGMFLHKCCAENMFLHLPMLKKCFFINDCSEVMFHLRQQLDEVGEEGV